MSSHRPTPVASLRRRLARAAAMAEQEALDGLLVTPGADLRYLIDYAPPPLERLTVLVVAPGRDPVLLVPTLERPAAIASPLGGSIEILTWDDGADPYVEAAGALGGGRRWAISNDAWAEHVLGLQRIAPSLRLVAFGRVLPLLRAVKDDDELARLEAAGAAADACFEAILRASFAGRRELDVAHDLEELLREHGHQSVDFTIVGSGPNGGSPHHEASDRVIDEGDVVVMDFGGSMDGYRSDTTRTVSVGEPSKPFLEVHEVVRRAQQAAFEAVRPGAPCQEIDRVARSEIESAGFGDRFLHRTGHGIGLETHESPYIARGDTTPLEPGMTFSIEPGIYLPRFGVRIEDVVAVTYDGAARLNDSSRDPQVVA